MQKKNAYAKEKGRTEYYINENKSIKPIDEYRKQIYWWNLIDSTTVNYE